MAKRILLYVVAAYTLSWVLWYPLYAPKLGLPSPQPTPFNHGIGALGPLLAALLVTGWFEGRTGIKALLRSCVRWRPASMMVVALLSPFLLALLAAALAAVVDDKPFGFDRLWTSAEFPQFNALEFGLYNLLLIGFGEEVGWRGFLLPRLQTKQNALAATLMLTLIWAGWHLPLFLYRPGYMAMGGIGILGWLLSLATGAVLLTWLFNSSRGSLLACAAFHATMDVAFLADFRSPSAVNVLGFLISLWGVLTTVVFKPKHLSRQPRVTALDQT